VHDRAANVFEEHAIEVIAANPARAAESQRSADRERDAAAREQDAADGERAKAALG
jgi:hypothetical protein